MINGEDLALADALAHGGSFGCGIRTHCERCFSTEFYIKKFEEKARCENLDIIIEREFIFICAECGALEADFNLIVIPSWVWSPKYEYLRYDKVDKKKGDVK